MLEIGSVIEGKYKILSKIGQGGMSIVYLAINERANKPWAIKEVRRDGVHDYEVVRQGLIVETEMLKKLSHPYLPSIVDVIDRDGSFLIVMDYIEGNTLAQVLAEEGTQPQERVISWAKQLCEVLGYLHSCDTPIIYRDLKPSNIMLKPDGSICLIDFGTAREYKENHAGDTTCLGTKGYAAPEQFGGMGQTDARTDIYCLGATLYHLVTGHNPCEPPYEIRPIREWDPALSQGLEKILLKCVNNNPEDRYQSCVELLYALEHYDELDNHYIRRQRKRLGIFSAVFGAAVVLGVSAISFYSAARELSGNNYDIFLEDAKSQPSREEQIEKYCMAIQLEPDNERAYLEFLDRVILEDDVLSVQEDETIRQILITDCGGLTCEERLRSNEAGYAEVAYRLGIAYFYCYEESGNKVMAAKWLDLASKSETLDEPQVLRAQCLSKISGYYAKIGHENKAGDAMVSYRDFWDDMSEATDGDIAQTDNSTTALIVYREMCNQIYTNAVNFKNAGVTQSELQEQIQNITDRLESDIVVTDLSGLERITDLKEQVETACKYAQQAVSNAFDVRVR